MDKVPVLFNTFEHKKAYTKHKIFIYFFKQAYQAKLK